MKNELPDGWFINELHELASKRSPYPIGDGDHGQIKPSDYKETGIPYIRVGDMINDEISLDKMVYISEEVHNRNLKSELYPEDIIIAKTGATIGKVAIIPKSIPIANTTASIGKITVDPDLILPKYLLYFIKTNQFIQQMWAVSKKSAQPGFNIKDMKVFTIVVPTLETQHKIVTILEKAEETKKLRAQADELTQQLLQNVFLEMFGDPVKNPKGWDKKPLSEVCQINPKKSEITVSDDLEVSFIPMECVTENGQIINSKIRLLSDVLKGFTYFREGDILFAKITPCMENGKGAIANNLKNGIGFGSTEFHVLRSQNVINEWVYHLLSFEFIRKIAYNNMTGSAGQKRVTKSFFDKLKVGVPPLEIQQQFADIVHKTEEITEKQKMSKHEINIIFNTLMQKAFNGELVS